LASKTDWVNSTKSGAVGNDLSKNNTSGFTALPGGCRGVSKGYGQIIVDYYNVGYICYLWLSGEDGEYYYFCAMRSDDTDWKDWSGINKEDGNSIRCIKD
jgi:uncharacterized protein (TIGR02145 family)